MLAVQRGLACLRMIWSLWFKSWQSPFFFPSSVEIVSRALDNKSLWNHQFYRHTGGLLQFPNMFVSENLSPPFHAADFVTSNSFALCLSLNRVENQQSSSTSSNFLLILSGVFAFQSNRALNPTAKVPYHELTNWEGLDVTFRKHERTFVTSLPMSLCRYIYSVFFPAVDASNSWKLESLMFRLKVTTII